MDPAKSIRDLYRSLHPRTTRPVLVPTSALDALVHPHGPVLRPGARVLVAGCGTGEELVGLAALDDVAVVGANAIDVAHGCVEPCEECSGKAPVLAETHHVIYPVSTGDLGGVVSGAVVNDQPLYRRESREISREVSEGLGECLCFVEAGDLDDQFHGAACCPTR